MYTLQRLHLPQPPRILVLQHYDKNYTGINLSQQTDISWVSRLAYSGLSMGGGLFFHWLPQKQRQNMNTGHMGQAGLGNGVTSFFFSLLFRSNRLMKLKTYLTFWQGGHNILSKSKQSVRGGACSNLHRLHIPYFNQSLAFLLFFCSCFSIN